MTNSPNADLFPSGGTPALDDNKDAIGIPRATGDPSQGLISSEVIKEKIKQVFDAE